MSKQELLSVLSDININSETALEAVSLYIKYLYFEQLIEGIVFGIFLGGIFFTAFTLIKILREQSK